MEKGKQVVGRENSKESESVLSPKKKKTDDSEPEMRTILPKVAIRSRASDGVIVDGCLWGLRGELNHKSYFRCSMTSDCFAYKQVYLDDKDPTVRVTIYDGAHNHHLPELAVASQVVDLAKMHASTVAVPNLSKVQRQTVTIDLIEIAANPPPSQNPNEAWQWQLQRVLQRFSSQRNQSSSF